MCARNDIFSLRHWLLTGPRKSRFLDHRQPVDRLDAAGVLRAGNVVPAVSAETVRRAGHKVPPSEDALQPCPAGAAVICCDRCC